MENLPSEDSKRLSQRKVRISSATKDGGHPSKILAVHSAVRFQFLLRRVKCETQRICANRTFACDRDQHV